MSALREEIYVRCREALHDWGERLRTAGPSALAPGHAEEIRLLVRELVAAGGPTARKSGPESVIDSTLRVVCAAARDRRALLARRKMFNEEGEAIRYLSPFIGDTGLAQWPFADPLTISDEEALRWLPLVAGWAPVSETVRRFVKVMYNTRKRGHWMPAACALARIASRDPAMFDFMAGEWAAAFLRGLPQSWPNGKCAGEGATAGAHRVRHALFTACALATTPSAPVLEGFAVSRFAAMSLPVNDASDVSLVVSCYAMLLSTAGGRAALLPHLPERVSELKLVTAYDPMIEETVRGVADVLRIEPGTATITKAIEAWLVAPRWMNEQGVRQLDALLVWGDTAAWLRDHGAGERLDGLRTVAEQQGAADFLALHLGERIHGVVELLVARLPLFFDRDVFATTPEPGRWILAAETFAAVRLPQLASLPWHSLVARAKGSDGTSPAAFVREAAPVALTRKLFELLPSEMSMTLLRDSVLEEPLVLSLSSSPNGFVARQVAIQAERILRKLGVGDGGRDEQIRFLWRLMQADPNESIFTEIAAVLRGEEGEVTPVHRIVSAVQRLDSIHKTKGGRRAGRRAGQTGKQDALDRPEEEASADGDFDSMAAIARAYVELAREVAVHLRGHLPHKPHTAAVLEALAAGLEMATVAVSISGPGWEVEPWLSDFRKVLIGEEPNQGLDSFLGFLNRAPSGAVHGQEQPPSTEGAIGAAFERLRQAVREAERASPRVNETDVRAVREAIAGLWSHLGPLAWPEGAMLNAFRRRLGRYCEELERKALDAERARNIVRRAIETGAEISMDRSTEGKREEFVFSFEEPEPAGRSIQDRIARAHAATEQGHQVWAAGEYRALAAEYQSREFPLHASKLSSLADALLANRAEPEIDDPIYVRIRVPLIAESTGEASKPDNQDVRVSAGLLDGDTARSLGRHFLRSLQFGDVRRLRSTSPFKASIPTVRAHLAPVLAGVAGGSVAMLDFTAFNDVLAPGHGRQAEVVTFAALMVSFALMISNLGSFDRGMSKVRIWAALARVAAAFGSLFLYSCVTSSLLLWVLAGTPVRMAGGVALPFLPQLLLWSSLAMFLGIFLGLIAQGRGLSKGE